MEWKISEHGLLLSLVVPTYDANRGEDEREGHYEIIVQRRPPYCDRGDWIIYAEGRNNDLDGADGFPRYFFGSEDEVKKQMETWVSRRWLALDAEANAGSRSGKRGV